MGDSLRPHMQHKTRALWKLVPWQVYNKAVHILATYFSCEEDAETQPEEVTTTAIQPQFAFNFGACTGGAPA